VEKSVAILRASRCAHRDELVTAGRVLRHLTGAHEYPPASVAHEIAGGYRGCRGRVQVDRAHRRRRALVDATVCRTGVSRIRRRPHSACPRKRHAATGGRPPRQPRPSRCPTAHQTVACSFRVRLSQKYPRSAPGGRRTTRTRGSGIGVPFSAASRAICGRPAHVKPLVRQPCVEGDAGRLERTLVHVQAFDQLRVAASPAAHLTDRRSFVVSRSERRVTTDASKAIAWSDRLKPPRRRN
jgi:hypothetical protein